MNRIFKNSKIYGRIVGIGKIIIVMAMTFALTGCAESISDKFLKQVDNNITFEQLIKNPDQYIGNSVLLGGVIISTQNKNDGTLLEIYQTELNSSGEPTNVDVSKGRFLAMDSNFLDSQIYRSGRKVTIAGVVKEVETRKIGDVDYRYPYLAVKDIYLWKRVNNRVYAPYNWGYYGPDWGYYGPMWWGPRDGWYYPYSGFRYYHPRHWNGRR